jgi:hypothetical protein
MVWNPLNAFTGDIQKQAADQKVAALQQGYNQYGDLATQGRTGFQNAYTAALDPYTAMQSTAGQGYNAYADASGANGPEGLARANAQYLSATPGFEGAAQRAANLTARAGVAGGAATGNVIDQIARNSTQQGLEAFGNYTNRLAPWLQQGQQTAAGISGINQGLGQGLLGSYTNQGQAALGTQGKIGEAQAAGTEGELTGYQNLFGLGLNALKAGAGFGGLPTGFFGSAGSTPGAGAQGPSSPGTGIYSFGAPFAGGTSFNPFQANWNPNARV